MANTLYDYARQRFLEGQFNWMTDTIKVILVDTGAYTPQTAIHQYRRISRRRPGSLARSPYREDHHRRRRRRCGCDVHQCVRREHRGNHHLQGHRYRVHQPADCIHRHGYRPADHPNGGDIIVTWDNGTNKIFKV